MTEPRVSIIMPARNAGKYIEDAIRSVIGQTWQNWELMVVDNASSDNTYELLLNFSDERIHVFRENQVGVSNARNCGLNHSKGEFICFLDADDKLTPRSLQIRLEKMLSDPTLEFCDGYVEYWNEEFSEKNEVRHPAFHGVPFMEVASLNPSCLCGITWLIRKVPGKKYHFEHNWTHSEDVAFYLSICKTGNYSFVNEAIYQVRRGHLSAMSDMRGLEAGYASFLAYVSTLEGIPAGHYTFLKKKIRSIMTKSHLKRMNIFPAISSWIRFS